MAESAIVRARRLRLEKAARSRDYFRRIREAKEAKERAAKKTTMFKSYGMMPEDYGAIMCAQGGLCAICGVSFGYHVAVNIDHCHRSGRVRGLLCRRCNTGLGHFLDDTSILKAAISYLTKPPAAAFPIGRGDRIRDRSLRATLMERENKGEFS